MTRESLWELVSSGALIGGVGIVGSTSSRLAVIVLSVGDTEKIVKNEVKEVLFLVA